MSTLVWVKVPVLLDCNFLGPGRNGSDALYRQLALTKAEQAGLGSDFSSLPSFTASCSEIQTLWKTGASSSGTTH